MGVQLNIKVAATACLARELADASGETVTAVIRSNTKRGLNLADGFSNALGKAAGAPLLFKGNGRSRRGRLS